MYYPPMRGNQGRVISPPPAQGGGFGQGVAQFIDAYRGERAAKKEQARNLFNQHVQMMQQGIPVDKKKMAKWAREADLHFEMDAPPPPPQTPMTPDPRMQQAAQAGMQQAMGGPQIQGAPPPPQQKPGFFNRIGAAMGVPQPPGQAEQMGVMRMLNDMQARGNQNAQMAQMQKDMQMKGLQAMRTIEQGLAQGLTMEDPRMAAALRTARVLGGMQSGDMGALGKVADSDMAAKLFPQMTKRIKEEAATAQKAEERMEYRKSIASKLDPEQAVAAESWVFGESSEAPGFATVDSKALNQSVQKLTSEYPAASPEKIKSAALMLFSKDADPADLSRAIKDLGESVAQTRLNISKQSQQLSAEAGKRAQEGLNRTKERDAEDEQIQMATGQILQLAGGDPDRAYDNAQNLVYAAFAGDRRKATQYLPEIKKALKGLSKNSDFLERLMRGAGEAGGKAALEQ